MKIEPNNIYCMDALTFIKQLPDRMVNCIVTSPPYYSLRDYGVDGQVGLEETPAAYIDALVTLFREARRALCDDGVMWLNLGDSYASGEIGRHDSVQGRSIDGRAVTTKFSVRQQSKQQTGVRSKNLLMIPARVAIALQADGWYLRSEIVWHKPNPMPESVTDRPTRSHEMIYLLTKNADYWYDADAIREPHVKLWNETNGGSIVTGRMARAGGAMGDMSTHPKGYPMPNPLGANKRDVWTVPTIPFAGAHFATFPEALITPCILAGCPTDGIVFDPFFGAGTTGLVAQKHGRRWLGCEINPEYIEMAEARLAGGWKEYEAAKQGKPYTVGMFDREGTP